MEEGSQEREENLVAEFVEIWVILLLRRFRSFSCPSVFANAMREPEGEGEKVSSEYIEPRLLWEDLVVFVCVVKTLLFFSVRLLVVSVVYLYFSKHLQECVNVA